MTVARRLVSGSAALALVVGGVLLGRDLYLRAKGAVAAVLIDRAWDARLDDGGEHRPWPWADFTPVARLEVARLGIDAPILSDATGRTLAFGLGRIVGSAALDADRADRAPESFGVAAIAGHRDTWAAFLERLEVGDILILRTGGTPRRFRVVGLEVVDARTARAAPAAGAGAGAQARLLLVTCWSFGSTRRGAERFVVDCALES